MMMKGKATRISSEINDDAGNDNYDGNANDKDAEDGKNNLSSTARMTTKTTMVTNDIPPTSLNLCIF